MLMTKLKLPAVVAIAFSAATMLFLSKTAAAAQPGPNDCQAGSTAQTCVVLITPNEKNPNAPPKITPNTASISKDDNEEVEWQCDPNFPDCQFTVVFTDETEKPFENRVFNNSTPKSGPPTGPKDKTKQYKYAVIVNGKGSADPMIIIK
jgi:hypothetical protein